MEAGETLSIAKQGFFSRAWEVTNAYGGRLGAFRTLRRFGYFKGEGEAGGATRTFLYSSWGLGLAEARDEWGHSVGAMHRGFLAREAQIILYEKEYVWHTDPGGTFFTIALTDGTELLRVDGCGGFGTTGLIRVHVPAENGELLTLAYMGIFQARAREAEAALMSGFLALLVLFGGSALFG
jgi:hypothetical protein